MLCWLKTTGCYQLQHHAVTQDGLLGTNSAKPSAVAIPPPPVTVPCLAPPCILFYFFCHHPGPPLSCATTWCHHLNLFRLWCHHMCHQLAACCLFTSHYKVCTTEHYTVCKETMKEVLGKHVNLLRVSNDKFRLAASRTGSRARRCLSPPP